MVCWSFGWGCIGSLFGGTIIIPCLVEVPFDQSNRLRRMPPSKFGSEAHAVGELATLKSRCECIQGGQKQGGKGEGDQLSENGGITGSTTAM